jgi:hypothetical protein
VRREYELERAVDVGRPAASRRDSIRWLQATTLTQMMRLSRWSGYGVTARHRCIPGIHYGIIELYQMSKGLLETVK